MSTKRKKKQYMIQETHDTENTPAPKLQKRPSLVSRSGQHRRARYQINKSRRCLTASPCGHRARMNSLSEETVVEGSYLVGPMSVPSKSRNLTSIGSFPPAISSPPDRRRPPTTPPLPKIHEAPDQRPIGARKRQKKEIHRNTRKVGI